MTIRIAIEREEAITVVRVAGRLAGQGALGELLRVCQATAGAIVIELSELRFADEEGLCALRSLRANGARIVGAPPYISLLLES